MDHSNGPVPHPRPPPPPAPPVPVCCAVPPGSFKDYSKGKGRVYHCMTCTEIKRQRAMQEAAVAQVCVWGGGEGGGGGGGPGGGG